MATTGINAFASYTTIEEDFAAATFANFTDLLSGAGVVGFATYTGLESSDKLSTFASLITLEKEAISSTYAARASVEDEGLSTFATDSLLEEEGSFLTFASFTLLEKVPLANIASLTTLSYTPSPTNDIVEEYDIRESGRKGYPVARWRAIITIPAGETSKTVMIKLNMDVRQISVKRPVTTGQTTTLTITDELDSQLYQQAALSSNATSSLISADPFIPLAGINQLNLTLSAALASDARYTVLIYGV